MDFPDNLIKSEGINKLRWDFSIIILAVYQALTIPIQITYDPDVFKSPIFRTINSLIDLVFIFDIIINFRTTKIDAYNGEVIIDSYNIAKHYVSSV